MQFVGIEWAGINRIWLLPIFIFFIFLVLNNYGKIKKLVSHLVNPSHMRALLKNYSPLRQLIKVILIIISFIFIFIALMQPRWGVKEEVVKQEGRDILFLLDVSRSMCAKDLKPSRLDLVKLKIKTLLKKIKSDRIGLILFADHAFVYCPLTVDYSAFLTLLSNVETESLFSGGTSIESALKKTIEHFDSAKSKNKLVILFTDGEDFSTNLQGIKEFARDQKIVLFAIGVGTTEGAPVPKFDHYGEQVGYETDENGKFILSKLNEELLRKLTKELNGKYLHISNDDSDIDKIVKFINKFDKEKFEDIKTSNLIERYPIFLTLSLIILGMEWIL